MWLNGPEMFPWLSRNVPQVKGAVRSLNQFFIISCLSPRYNNRHQFLQLDLGRISKVIRVATQGRAMASQWVTVYYLSFSVDGVHFARYKKNSRVKVRKRFRVAHPIRLPFDQ